MIEALFFDLDDTLISDQMSVKAAFAETCKMVLEKYNIEPEKFEEAVRKEACALYTTYHTYPFTQMIGINPFEGLWGNFCDEYNDSFRELKRLAPIYRKEAWTRGLKMFGICDPVLGSELADRFPIERRKYPFVFKETFQTLDQLRGRYHLLLLTNGSPDLQNTKLSLTPELVPYFDHIVISGAFGKGKPDPAIFENALSLLSIKKDQAVMIGDNLMTDILGAEKAGVISIWVNRDQKESDSNVIPDFEIESLEGLIPILEDLNNEA